LPSKLKIAVVAALPFPTLQGSQVVVRQFSETLSERGHQVHLVTYGYGQFPYHPTFDIHRIRDLASYRKLSSGPSFMKTVLDSLLAFKLREVCARHGIQIISAHNYEAAVVGVLVGKMLRIPVVYHSHGLLSQELCTYFRAPFSRMLAQSVGSIFDRFVPRMVKRNVVFTQEEKSALQKLGVASEGIEVVPPGISISAPRALETSEASPTPTAVYAGNLDRYQNLPLILEAFERVCEEVPEAVLRLVSAGDFAPLREETIQRGIENNVEFVNATSFREILALLSASHVGLTARTLKGGFPIKILNYLSAGLPVVAFESGSKGVRHLHNGYLAPDGDVETYARGITMLLKDGELRARLGKNALAEAEDYSWERVISEVETVYRQIASP
jgi:glycosyltransferase involved in cell wall biosynthesis